MAFYGNYSHSFVPNASDTNTGQAFDPEEGRSYELGVKLDLPQGIGASLALFDIEKKNVVVTNNSVSEAAGKVGSRGVELDISGRLSERWELLGSYAYTDTEILDDPSNEGTSWSTPHAMSAVSTSSITCIYPWSWVSGNWVVAPATSASVLATTPTHSGWIATPWPMPSSLGTANCLEKRRACN